MTGALKTREWKTWHQVGIAGVENARVENARVDNVAPESGSEKLAMRY